MKNLNKVLTPSQKKEVKAILKSLNLPTVLGKYDFTYDVKAMGSGGVGQIKYMPGIKQIRVQTSYGKGRHNYADVIIINI